MGLKDWSHNERKDSMSRKRSSDQTPLTETTTTVAEPGAPANDNTPAANDNQPSFAERVGQRQRPSAPDPFGIAGDYLAGVRLFESKQDRQMAIKFTEKPSQAVIDKLKDAGYRWNPTHKIWTYPVGGDSALRTRIDAERLYQEIRTMIREEKGIAPGQEVPF
jgi:hypothetical protein